MKQILEVRTFEGKLLRCSVHNPLRMCVLLTDC